MFSAPPARTPKHPSIIGFNAIQVKKREGKVAGLCAEKCRSTFVRGRLDLFDFLSNESCLSDENGLGPLIRLGSLVGGKSNRQPLETVPAIRLLCGSWSYGR